MIEVAPFSEDSTRGFLYIPDSRNGDGLVVTHGAGGDCQAAIVVGAATAFANHGLLVLRIDLPFRQRRKHGPPFPAHSAEDRKALALAASQLRRMISAKLFLGGHSYGGRQASMLAAEDEGLADGLLLLSYPLHPPKRPEQTRTAHFPDLRTPALFVHGTRDPFGSIDKLRQALSLIPAPTELFVVEGAGHDLARGRIDGLSTMVSSLQELASSRAL
jgi:predicted alpha/beta-hydrolase family hydrolase